MTSLHAHYEGQIPLKIEPALQRIHPQQFQVLFACACGHSDNLHGCELGAHLVGPAARDQSHLDQCRLAATFGHFPLYQGEVVPIPLFPFSQSLPSACMWCFQEYWSSGWEMQPTTVCPRLVIAASAMHSPSLVAYAPRPLYALSEDHFKGRLAEES